MLRPRQDSRCFFHQRFDSRTSNETRSFLCSVCLMCNYSDGKQQCGFAQTTNHGGDAPVSHWFFPPLGSDEVRVRTLGQHRNHHACESVISVSAAHAGRARDPTPTSTCVDVHFNETYRVALRPRRLKPGFGSREERAVLRCYDVSVALPGINAAQAVRGFTDLSASVYVACKRDKPLSRRDICAPSLQTAFPPAGSSPSQGFSLFLSNTHTSPAVFPGLRSHSARLVLTGAKSRRVFVTFGGDHKSCDSSGLRWDHLKQPNYPS